MCASLGEYQRYIRPVFKAKRAKLAGLIGITTETQIRMTGLYFGFQANMAFVLPMLPDVRYSDCLAWTCGFKESKESASLVKTILSPVFCSTC